MSSDASTPRWQHYVLLRGDELHRFWAKHLNERERQTLVLVGRGFDPRMCLGLELLLGAGGAGRRDVLALEFHEGTTSPSLAHADSVGANWQRLQSLVDGRGAVRSRPVGFFTPDNRRVTSQNARDLIADAADLDGYSDIVVDISAMPRSVFFPLLARLLYFLDGPLAARCPPVNLHVLVAEDPGFDAAITEEGIDEKAEFMASFGGGFDQEAIHTPNVWIPILGEKRITQFDRIRDLVKPDEICPVLPFPARNPRRGDDIVIEYQQILFDVLRLDPREFLYAAEQNPFEVYRQIRAAAVHYRDVFRLLGGCKVALSSLSSKVMSLGALLVAYELKQAGHLIGVGHIECMGYTLPTTSPAPEFLGAWLAGECYA
jgi:hypothetical protein